jgi:hypothetical protein|nr:MAG TPA: hypothetical protein [Caudoviricetes sp.]
MWEKGTRVKIIGGAKIGLMGTVVVKHTENPVNDIRDRFLVEFDESMGGHSGNGAYKGKRGHCWWFDYCLDKFTATDGISIEQVKRKNNFY